MSLFMGFIKLRADPNIAFSIFEPACALCKQWFTLFQDNADFVDDKRLLRRLYDDDVNVRR